MHIDVLNGNWIKKYLYIYSYKVEYDGWIGIKNQI